jgi:hypothetical protein
LVFFVAILVYFFQFWFAVRRQIWQPSVHDV